MKNININLISYFRMISTWLVLGVSSEVIGNTYYTDNYHVNINNLLDKDEDFLF